MDNKYIQNVKKLLKSDNAFFGYISVAFGLILSFVRMSGDDVGQFRVEGGFIAYWNQAVKMYQTWSSRILLTLTSLYLDDDRKVLWAIFMGFSLFVLMYSISKLFVKDHAKECNAFIAALVMMYPFRDMATAGWISTLTQYLSPIAFGLYSLIPIKKVLKGEKFSVFELVAFPLALIFGANNEQVMVMVLGCYLVAFIYLITVHRFHLLILIQLLLAIASCFVALCCPGAWLRKDQEVFSWFPTWGMFNFIDKVDLGYSTTMQWFFFGSNLFAIFICFILGYLMWQKYSSTAIRVTAALPPFLMLLYGPLRPIVSTFHPFIYTIPNGIPAEGLVTAENRGNFEAFFKFAIWAVFIIIICVEIILLLDSFQGVLAAFVLAGTGMASRLAMGFSPTIYGSGERTCGVFAFCIISVTCLVYSTCISNGQLSEEKNRKLMYPTYLLMAASFVHLICVVALI